MIRTHSRPSVAAALVVVLLSAGAALGRPIGNLKDLSPDQQVTSVGYCRGEYEVSLGDGHVRRFKEYDLALKIDSSPHGPNPAKPALVLAGRLRNRAVVIFSDVEELRRGLKTSCRD